MDEQVVIQQLLQALMNIEDNTRRIAEAMETANERPQRELDEFGDPI